MTKDERARQAREVLSNPVFMEAVSTIEERIIGAWKTTSQNDVEGRERLYKELNAARKLYLYLEMAMEDGGLSPKKLRSSPRLLGLL